MTEGGLPIELIALTLILALIGGLSPIYSNMKGEKNSLRRITGLAAGILLASAVLVVIPEGFELATGGHDDHGHAFEDALAGSTALVILEVEHGEITVLEAIEEIERLIGGHGEENHNEPPEEESHDEESERSEERRVGKECRSRWSPYH